MGNNSYLSIIPNIYNNLYPILIFLCYGLNVNLLLYLFV